MWLHACVRRASVSGAGFAPSVQCRRAWYCFAAVGKDEALTDFTVISTLGEGGMGRVVLARQRSLEREVALKTLQEGAGPEASAALLREARIAGALEHPGVVPIHLLTFDEAGKPMLVMKRVDGIDLATLLADEGHPMWRAGGRHGDRLVAAVEILIQVCLTLQFAHSRGVVHRDIKPKNIMVGSFGEVYLLDWGVASTMADTSATSLAGTPDYMPPEMATGRPGDQRSDVYLLGAALHEVLTGRPRHQGSTIAETLRSATISAPYVYPDSVPRELADLCNRATARSPGARPASIGDVREELSSFIRRRSTRALNDAALERLTELEALLAPGGSPADVTRAYRLVTEARFGFTLALRDDPADPAALAGIRTCLALAIELELRQDHAESAEALLREMDVEDADLAKRVAAVRENQTAHRREHHRLKRLERELDPSQHARNRGILLILFWIVGVAIGRVVTLGGALSPERIALGSVVSTVLFCSGLFVVRHRIGVAWNAFNKRLIALVILAMTMVVVHRVLALVHHARAEDTMTMDTVIAAGVLLYAAYAYLRRLVIASVPLVVALPLAVLWPAQAPFLFVSALAIATPVAALVVMGTQPPRE